MIHIACAIRGTCILRAFNTHLEKIGPFKVIITANSADDLIRQLDIAEYKPDVCIIGTSPDGIKAYDTIHKLTLFYPQLKVIALSATLNPLSLLLLSACGILGYINYDCSDDDLAIAIMQVYGGIPTFHHQTYKLAQNYISKKKRGKNNLLSKSEIRVTQLLTQHLRSKQIASVMNISTRTVEDYCRRIYSKLNISGRDELLKLAYDIGL